MVRDETDRCHHHGGYAFAVQRLQVVADVGFQPRDVRGTAAGLVDELPGVLGACPLGHRRHDQPCHVQVLGDVGTAVAVRLHGAGGVRGRGGDGVRGEGEVRARPLLRRQLGQRGEDPVHHRLDEAGVVEVVPQLVDAWHGQPLGLQRGQRLGEVLAVLPAAGVRGVGAGGQDGDAAVPGPGHLAQGVGQVGRPVAVAPVHGQIESVFREVLAQGVEQRPVLAVDRADSAEEEVVLADFLQPLLGDSPATGDVREERNHVVRSFGASEGEQQQGVVGSGIAQIGHDTDPATRPRPRSHRHPPRGPTGNPAVGDTGPPVSCIGHVHP